MPIAVKICGITTEDAMTAAVRHGAAFVGMVFFPPSPRFIAPTNAAELLDRLPEDVQRVGLFVDPDDDMLASVLAEVRLDLLQLHGNETPTRVEAIRQEFALPVMKVIRVAVSADLTAAEAYFGVADWLLFDAKPAPDAENPGGNARSFDWSLLKDHSWPLPWMLAGGLDATNIDEAVRKTGASVLDVSSGVEDRPGIKNPDKIRNFLAVASNL